MFDHLERFSAVWPDGSSERIDAIVWATGFRPDIRHLSPLKLHEKAGGVAVTTGAAERDPPIFFAGYGPTASTVGANRAGRTLARQVFAALARPRRRSPRFGQRTSSPRGPRIRRRPPARSTTSPS